MSQGADKILLVDDDPNILAGYRRLLRGRYQVSIAPGGKDGLALIHQDGPFAVVVADMRMPGMDGVEFLSRVKKTAPLTVRMMLTGNADQGTAINAINNGSIFRFNTKPCAPEEFQKSLAACLNQHRLLTLEQDLLQTTLAGSVKLLTDVVSVFDPEAYGRVGVIREWASRVAAALRLENSWRIDMAAMLGPIGQIALPPQILAKKMMGGDLSRLEKKAFRNVPEVGRNLIRNIPRMKTVSEIVYYQAKGFDGSGFPDDAVAGKDIPAGARLLRILNDLHALCAGQSPGKHAFRSLENQAAVYDPDFLAATKRSLLVSGETTGRDKETASIALHCLLPGYKLVSDIETVDGKLMLAAGHEVSSAQVEILRGLSKFQRFKEPIHVIRPVSRPKHAEAADLSRADAP